MELTKENILNAIKDWSPEELGILSADIAKLHVEALKRAGYENKNDRLLLANADYESRCTKGYKPNVRATERWWKLHVGALLYFRANRKRRKHGKVATVSKSKEKHNENSTT